MASGPRAHYESRGSAHSEECRRLAGSSRRLSHMRAATFAAAVLFGLWAERNPGSLGLALVAAAVTGFVVLVVLHRRLGRRREWCRELVAYNREGVHRIGRDWDRLPLTTAQRDIATHAFAADLDVFGRASLTQILGPAGSAFGASTLEAWLLERAPADTIEARQAAVAELAPLYEFRERLAILGRRTRDVLHDDVERVLRWAEKPPWLAGRRGLRLAAYVLPALTWTLIALHATGVIGSALWLVPVIATVGVYFSSGSRVRQIFEEAFGREAVFDAYPELLAVAASERFQAPALQTLSQRLRGDSDPAHARLGRLRRLMNLADLRFSSFHLPVYAVTMWDVHVLHALERWQRTTGSAVRDWLAATGELEALASLATLAHDQPGWTFAELAREGPPVLDCEDLGHPLLADDVRVGNDVQVGPPGTFLFITGSNMSGKSTLLRAIGTNVVLAQAGGPSCARRLRIPALDIFTSIRVQDSLARGVSYFMAELERLKQVVDAAHAAREVDGVTLLFLLDEILHGTNTAERRIAARRVVRHLVESGAIGGVTTHDLDLADSPELAAGAVAVHFQERLEEGREGGSLDFDYRLRPGLATSTNALKLMRLVGLPGD
jgi:hypothetical protein